MNVTTIGLDIAKNVFHVVGVEVRGKEVLKRRLRRAQVLEFFAKLVRCVVGMEACGGAHYWARELSRLGHEVRLIHPRYVEPYRRGEKNDYNDAWGLCEAVVSPRMRFVTVKSEGQQDLQALHRVRSGLVKERTGWVNRGRGLLAERGVVMGKGVGTFRRRVPELLEEGENRLSMGFREVLGELYERVVGLDEQIAAYDRRLARASAGDEGCGRLDEIPGVGAVVATALVGAVGDGRAFRSGRELAAFVGLVPRQHSSGGRPRLLGIGKRGDPYLRTLLIHGARSVVRCAAHKDDALSRWVEGVRARRGTNVAVVALANKLARIAFVVLAHGERYRPERAARG